MGPSTEDTAYKLRGTVANGLAVIVHTSLPEVANLLTLAHAFERSDEHFVAAAEVWVQADPTALQHRVLLHEYSTRIEWQDATHARVEINGAHAAIEWSGASDEVLRATLGIYPPGAPESVGMFLRLLVSLLLPPRDAALIHASGVVIDGEARVFLGESGAGKTTTARRAGREGALRLADDLAILRVREGKRVFVEACRFDRGGRLPNRAGEGWPVCAVYDIRKAAAVTLDAGKVENPLATWCAAVLSSSGPPALLDSLLSFALRLNTLLPPRVLRVAPAGPVLPALIQSPQIPSTSHVHRV